MKIRYDIINKKGVQEEWTDIFQTEKEADQWYENHGKYWESQGKQLKRVIIKSKRKNGCDKEHFQAV